MYRIGEEEINAVARVIRSKNLFKINDGLQEVMHFQQELENLFHLKHALLMTSGKAALISGLIALGIGPGDEVIVPAYTYIATALAVTAVGAIPVIAEIDETLTLDPEDVKANITSHTKAIIPVHIQGFPCQMDTLCAIAKEHNLAVLEDACQADGGSYHGQRLGSIGQAGALSFNQYKIITAGEGGALLTNDTTLFQRALIYHDSSAVTFFGDKLSDCATEVFCGSEFRSNEITGAILREQLKRLDGILTDLRRSKQALMDQLKDAFTFIPSNDPEGDCGTTVAFSFADEQQARAFSTAKGVNGYLPIDTGKHVYSNWRSILNKRGALNPSFDPFLMTANKDIVPDYAPDMCPKTLDILSRTVYISVSPDWTESDIRAKAEACRNAMQKAEG